MAQWVTEVAISAQQCIGTSVYDAVRGNPCARHPKHRAAPVRGYTRAARQRTWQQRAAGCRWRARLSEVAIQTVAMPSDRSFSDARKALVQNTPVHDLTGGPSGEIYVTEKVLSDAYAWPYALRSATNVITRCRGVLQQVRRERVPHQMRIHFLGDACGVNLPRSA